MDWDGKKMVPLLATAKYVAVCFKGKTDLTKKADERWRLHYKLLAVMDAKSENEDDAARSVGKSISDNLIDIPGFAYKWDMLLPAMFPEIKASGEKKVLHGEDCIGKVVVIRIGEAKGNPDFNEAEKINRIYGWEPFTGDKAQFADEIRKVLPDEAPAQEAPAGNDEFDGQF